MAKKLTDVQVIDLGSHVIKCVGLSAKGPDITVEKAHSVVLTDSFTDANRYINDVRGAMDGMSNSGILDKKVPIFFLAGEALMPVSIAYLNNQKPEDVEISMEDSLGKFVAAEGTSTMEATVQRSFKLREKPQAGELQIVAAHAYSKYDTVNELREVCLTRKQAFGGVIPKIFSYQALFDRFVASDPAVAESIVAIIDIGYNSANLVALKEGNIVFHKSLHIGARDFFNELRNVAAEKSFFQLTFPQFTDFMRLAGVTGDPDGITSSGLPINDPAPISEAVNEVCEEICTKIRLSLDYFSTVSATDFNTSMATVMAVRKGAEHIFLTGGLVASTGFIENAREQLSDEVQVMDPVANLGGTVTGDVPALHYSIAVGGGLLALGDKAEQYNMASMLEGPSGSAAASDAAAGFMDLVPKWAHIIALLVLLFVGYEYWEVNSGMANLLKQRKNARNELRAAKDFFKEFAEAKKEFATSYLKLEFVRELMRARPDLPALLQELASASKDTVKITRFRADVTYPSMKRMKTPDGETEINRLPLVVNFTLAGEARTRDQIFGFSRNLTSNGNFADLEQPKLIEAGLGTNPFTPGGVRIPNSTARFYFEISGRVRSRKP